MALAFDLKLQRFEASTGIDHGNQEGSAEAGATVDDVDVLQHHKRIGAEAFGDVDADGAVGQVSLEVLRDQAGRCKHFGLALQQFKCGVFSGDLDVGDFGSGGQFGVHCRWVRWCSVNVAYPFSHIEG